jgi:hypothetical protein
VKEIVHAADPGSTERMVYAMFALLSQYRFLVVKDARNKPTRFKAVFPGVTGPL